LIATTSLILKGEIAMIQIRWVDGAGKSPATTTHSHCGLRDQRRALTIATRSNKLGPWWVRAITGVVVVSAR
jgi:hypothetical protein